MRPETARLLAVSSPCRRWVDDTPPASRSALKPEDVSAALAKMSPAAALYVRVRYSDQHQYVVPLTRSLLVKLLDHPKSQTWPIQTARTLIELALLEVLLGSRFSARYAAREIGCSPATFLRRWQAGMRYVVAPMIGALEAEASAVLARE